MTPAPPAAPDLEPGCQPPELPQLLQDEDVRHPGGHPHGLWGGPRSLQPRVRAQTLVGAGVVGLVCSPDLALLPQALWPVVPAAAGDPARAGLPPGPVRLPGLPGLLQVAACLCRQRHLRPQHPHPLHQHVSLLPQPHQPAALPWAGGPGPVGRAHATGAPWSPGHSELPHPHLREGCRPEAARHKDWTARGSWLGGTQWAPESCGLFSLRITVALMCGALGEERPAGAP